jgi:uncharacterized protein (TIGR02117 family)
MKPYAVKPTAGPGMAMTGGETVYVVSHGWHTGLVVPARAIQQQFPELRTRFGNTPFLEFGWGDRDFYQAEEITTGLTLKAIFWPTESVIHVVAVPEKADEYFSASRVEKLCLSDGEYASLRRFIANSFHENEHGKLFALNEGLYGDSQFYKGTGRFYLMNTCNKWTAKGLKSAGLDVSAMFKLTAGSVIGAVQKLKQANPGYGCNPP